LAVVELPRSTPEDPLRVVLHPACSIHLILHGPFGQQDPSEDLWRFRYRISAPGGVFDDRRHPALSDGSQRSGPDDLREFLEGTVSSSGSTRSGDGTVSFAWTFDRPEWRFEALRPGHPLLLQIEIDRCPKSFGKAPSGVVWESVGVSLADGETRRIVVDLSGLQPGG
jgi:hypothetical protein